MMPAARSPLRSFVVLRNAVLHDAPHALARPSRGMQVDLAAAPVQPEPEAAAPLDRYEEGFNAGLQEAGDKARAELAQARLENDRAAESAAQAGFDQGHAQGLAQGREQARLELEQLRVALRAEAELASRDAVERLARVGESLAAHASRIAQEAQDDLLALAHEAVCKVLGERATDPQALAAMVGSLVARHGGGADWRIHVHPADAAAIAEAAAGDSSWDWIADDSVAIGGVLLRSDRGTLDARFEVQLQGLRDALLRARHAWQSLGREAE